MYEGLGPDGEQPREQRSPRTQHRTWLGADFHRRFRARYLSMGMRWVETAIVPAEPHVEWTPGLSDMDPPRYARLSGRLWPPLYWLRKHWDGLRFGLDRDAR